MLKLLRRKSSFRRSKDFREDRDRESNSSRRRSVDGFGNKSPRNYRRGGSSSSRHHSQERKKERKSERVECSFFVLIESELKEGRKEGRKEGEGGANCAPTGSYM